MTSSRSPLDVLLTAHRLGEATLPMYASKFSRKTFTLPQLFACLALRQFYNLSYRRTEALLADCPNWREAIGMTSTPDHNTLCDAFGKLTEQAIVGEMFDRLAAGGGDARLVAGGVVSVGDLVVDAVAGGIRIPALVPLAAAGDGEDLQPAQGVITARAVNDLPQF